MENFTEKKENFQKTLRVGGDMKYDDEHSRLYAKLPVAWCRRLRIVKGEWIKVIDEGNRLIIELPGGARDEV